MSARFQRLSKKQNKTKQYKILDIFCVLYVKMIRSLNILGYINYTIKLNFTCLTKTLKIVPVACIIFQMEGALSHRNELHY